MQHLGYSPTAEAGNDRYHELVAPLLMARQPANLVRMPLSTSATLAQACRKLTLILLATPPNKELIRFIGSNLKNLRG